jgi:hypothetical protein
VPALRATDTRRGEDTGEQERRRAARYATNDALALIAWVDGDRGHKVTASLKNISADGAQAQTDYAPLPQLGTPVLFRLVSDVTDWVVHARVISVSRPRVRRQRFSLRKQPESPWALLHLAFLEPCPYELFKASIAGFAGARR